MARPLPTSSFAVLGMVSMTPLSGYELAQAVQRSIAYFWPMSKTQVYSELSRLESLGYVESTQVAQERLPDKRVYRLTAAGERELDRWLVEDQGEGPTFRIPSLVKVFFGHRMPRADLLGLIESMEQECQIDIELMERLVEVLEGIPKAAHAWASALMGLRMTEATRAWAAEARQKLAAVGELEDRGDEDAELFRELMRQAPPFTGWRQAKQTSQPA